MSRVSMLALAALTVSTTALAGSNATPNYALAQEWKLGGPGGWDYLSVDPITHRLYVSRGDRMEIVDTTTGKIAGTVPGTAGVHGAAIAHDLDRGFTSNGKSNSVTVFELSTFKVLEELPVTGANPDAIIYDPATKRVFAFNGKSHDVAVIDAQTLKALGNVAVPDKPEFAATDGQGHIFLNIEAEQGLLVRIDSSTLKVDATWKLTGCAEPTGLALDVARARVYSVCANKKMAVTDAKTGQQIALLPIGAGPDAAEFDASRGLAFSSNGEGTLTVVKAGDDTPSVAATVPTQKGARTMALETSTGKIFLATAEFGPPPAPTAEQPRPRPTMVPDSFRILVVEPR